MPKPLLAEATKLDDAVEGGLLIEPLATTESSAAATADAVVIGFGVELPPTKPPDTAERAMLPP